MSKSGLWTVFLFLMAGVGSSHAESIRVNVGGDTYTDVSGNLWSADRGCNTGILNTISGPVQGTPDEFLFLTTRWDDSAAPEMTCSYAVSPGLYKVTLYFTESNSRNFKNGARVFDVLIEGLLEFDNLDIYREAGANTAAPGQEPADQGNCHCTRRQQSAGDQHDAGDDRSSRYGLQL
jgi:hypothetical protein